MSRYQSSSQSSILAENINGVSGLIQGFFLFAIEVSLTLIKNLLGFRDIKGDNNLAKIDEIVPMRLQPSASVSGFHSLRFDANASSFENHEYHPWLVVIVTLLVVGMLSYDLNKSHQKPKPLQGPPHTVEEQEQVLESRFAEDNSDDESLYKEDDLPVLRDMPMTFRTQRKEVGLPYQDVTVSRSTPLSLLLWETK